MHGAVQDFLAACRRLYPEQFGDGCRVVEFGSRDINGTPRPHFGDPAEWIGVDCIKGRNVDVLGLCHEFDPEVADFDVVVSTEALEHDPYWEKTLRQAAKLLRSGGVLALSCGSEHRPSHHENDRPPRNLVLRIRVWIGFQTQNRSKALLVAGKFTAEGAVGGGGV